MAASQITPEIYQSMGLNDFEYSRILELMGREPTLTELGMFAVMWSEHCGYKYSRPVLALFKKYKEAMEGAGLENAGVVDIGDGIGVTMKVESHNHPSAVEPYQGAATGVGGIIRDILTMGARPIAGLNSLRFGPIDGDDPITQRNRFLFEHVVEGIGGYGNCVGVPTVAGEVNFHPRYSGNPLVNAMCVGIMKLEDLTTAAAEGVGNPVIYIGSATGRDGIHGATFASEGMDEESEAKRPNVQIGDPFAEKLLIEATLEALKTGAIVAIQDMGAAGLTCSTVEMASKGSVGMSVDLDLVPMREDDMSAYELMLSESQERMLAVAAKGREEEVLAVCRKWGLKAEVIGYVTEDGETTVTRRGEIAAQVNPKHLTDFCPTYTPEFEVPEYHRQAAAWSPDFLPEIDPAEGLRKLLASPNIASKKWVYGQYDYQVQTQTAVIPGVADAAVLAPRGTKKGLAVKIDGNGRQVFLDPYRGGQLVVAEAARNVACTGAKPVAVTDGLNFGNPQRPHVYWQFKESVLGIAEAAEALETPVISGNVSFYNERSDLGEILPTPMIGMLGLLENAEDRLTMASHPGLAVYLLSIPGQTDPQRGLGASEALSVLYGQETGLPAATDLAAEKRLCDLLAEAAKHKLVAFAHDTAEGGLAIAAAECVIVGTGGMEISLPNLGQTLANWFAELPGRVLVGIKPENQQRFEDFVQEMAIELTKIGGTTDSRHLVIDQTRFPVDELSEIFENAIPRLMKH
jgi:phosphoribosylformylglycinamidine synthase subunit PurL